MPAPYYKEGVKYFHSGMQGAPTLSNVAGNGIAMLDACLVNGFGTLTLTSLAVSGNVATATIAGGHLYTAHSVIEIAGAAPAGLNGQWKIRASGLDATHFSFDTTGIADQTATGTITSKIAPLGWAKAFSGANLAAYKSGDAAASGCYLRVDDTGTTNMRVRGYGSMTGISAGTDPFPSLLQQASDAYWPKHYGTGGNKAWTIVGDERFFMLHVASGAHAQWGWGVYFGDVAALSGADAFACTILSPSSDFNIYGSTNVPEDFLSMNATPFVGASSPATFIARPYNGVGRSMAQGQYSMSGSAFYSGGPSAPLAYPHVVDTSLRVARVGTGTPWRGHIPGLYALLNRVSTVDGALGYHELVSGIDGDLSGRVALALGSGNNHTPGLTAPGAWGLIDITGPWR